MQAGAGVSPSAQKSAAHGRPTDTGGSGPRDCWVYRCLDDQDDVLYVGLTGQGIGRFKGGHDRNSEWWRTVTTIKVKHFDTYEEAARYEQDTIRRLRPPHNRHHIDGTPSGLPERPVTRAELASHLGCKPDTVTEFVQRGMPHTKLGPKVYRFKVSEVELWLETHGSGQ